jgi:hypothetical protein
LSVPGARRANSTQPFWPVPDGERVNEPGEPALLSRVGVLAKAGRGAWFRRMKPIRWHNLRRVDPLERRFGFSRGTPVDRFYIELFLEKHRDSVHGEVLEVGDSMYTTRFGGERVTRVSVLHADAGAPDTDIVGDLTKGLPGYERSFDCLVLTQVFPFLFDVRAAVATTHELCRAEGTVLATVPGISQISRYDMDRWGDFWRFTPLSVQRLFADEFGASNVDVEVYGNVLAAVALLHGVAAEELSENELSSFDRDYPVVIGVVARAGH